MNQVRHRLEIILVAAVGLAAAGMCRLQYRWTDELSRAERSRLHGALESCVRRIAGAFEEGLAADPDSARRFFAERASEYPEFEFSVTRRGKPEAVLFSTRPDGASVLAGADRRAALPRGWMLAARHRSGSLEAAVSRTRTRNLLTALLFTALLAGTAWGLVGVTARSRRLAEMQFRFAAGVSHDLRTPLTAIRGAAFSLSKGLVQDPDAIRRYHELILRNADQLTGMVENVLAYTSTLEDSKAVREPLSIAALLERTTASLAPEIEAAGCRAEIEIELELPTIRADAWLLEQAFRNLIGNAIRHAKQGQWIGISARACDGGVELHVRDRGPGIPAREHEKIFQPFYRAASNGAGAGLGLSLVRNTVLAHGGSIRVESSPGAGADFAVWLPGGAGAA